MRSLVATLVAATLLLSACAGREEEPAPSAPAPAAVGVELQHRAAAIPERNRSED